MANNSAPYEILAGPAEIYVADEGTTFPDVDETPGTDWVQLATALQIPEEGVTITSEGEETGVKSLGGTGVRKGFRTSQEVHVKFKVMNATIEAYSAALNGASITTVAASAGVPGSKAIEISMPGGAIETKALLVRSLQSPYGDGMAAQWEFARAYNMGHPETVYVKGEPVALDFDYFVMDDDNGDKGICRAQTAPAA